MTGKKVNLAWIESDYSRSMTLKRRRAGLVKKVNELSILCDVRACTIIFSPNEAEPVVWPSAEKTHGLLDEFFSFPKFKQNKKQTSVESYLNDKTKKIHEELMKIDKQKKEYVTNELMIQLQSGRRIGDLTLSEIYTLISFLKDNIICCRKKLDSMQFTPLRDPPLFPFEVQVEAIKTTTNDIFHNLVESVSQPFQHHNMNYNPIMTTNQQRPHLFDFMSRNLEVSKEGSNIHNSHLQEKKHYSDHDGFCQEPAPNGTTAGEDNADVTSFDINRILPVFKNDHI